MSGKDFKRGGRRRDRISELPDDIIVYILSFLPLKEAAATSLVSRRWSHLWRYTPNLIFKNNRDDPMINKYDDRLMRYLKNIEWVNSVLNSHKALSLNQFAISFYIHKQYSYQFLTKCLCFAFSRRVESLSLDLHFATYVLDCNILSSIHTSDYKFLKELKLESLNVSGEAIELFLRNSPLLERLILRLVDLTSDLLVVGGSALKYLEIVSHPRRRGTTTIVSAPNLTRLGYCCYDLRFFFLENVPNLIEALFHLRGPHDTMQHFAKAASRLETLTLSLCKPRVFPVPQMPRLQKLLVDILFTKKEFRVPITRLIQASPCLEEFRLKVTYLYRYISNRSSSMIEVPRAGNEFVHQHLKVFEFEGFCGSTADHVELVRYVGDSCSKGLREIIITPMPVVRVLPYEEDDYMDSKESPYVVWTGSLDRDVIEAKVEEAELEIHEWTERVLAAALPKRIKLTILPSGPVPTFQGK